MITNFFRLAKKLIGIKEYPEILLYLSYSITTNTTTMSICHWPSMTRLWSRDKCKDVSQSGPSPRQRTRQQGVDEKKKFYAERASPNVVIFFSWEYKSMDLINWYQWSIPHLAA